MSTTPETTSAALPRQLEAALDRLSEKLLAASLVVSEPPQWLTVEEGAAWISAKAYSTTPRAVRDLPIERKLIAGKLRLNRGELEAYVSDIIERAPSAGQANETALQALAEKRARQADNHNNDPEQGDGEEKGPDAAA